MSPCHLWTLHSSQRQISKRQRVAQPGMTQNQLESAHAAKVHSCQTLAETQQGGVFRLLQLPLTGLSMKLL